MIEQLLKLVTQNADEVIQNNNVPASSKDGIVREVATQISDGIGDQIKQGNLTQVLSIFKGDGGAGVMNNPIVRQILTSTVASLASKFGLSPTVAENIAGTLLPKVISQFIDKTNDPSDSSFDLSSIMKSFSSNPRIDDLLKGLSNPQQKGLAGDVFGKLFGQ